jgi:hypothetical protein
MKKQILLIVMTLCAMSAMAVSLPSKSYRSYGIENSNEQPYTLSVGTKFVNASAVGARYSGACTNLGKDLDDFTYTCTECCARSICEDVETESDINRCERETDDATWSYCMTDCAGHHLNQPLDAPTAFLLALVAAYGAIAVYRKKMQEV